ncbi:hypothetical protein BDZ94DRAFT_1128102, partial [Collybia nuda]
FGDYYRGCGHFIKAYYSGEKVDCNSPNCVHSVAHTHRAPNCPCSRATQDIKRIMSMFHQPCDPCRSAEFDRI